MWYFAGVPAQSRRKTPIEDIRARYGSIRIASAPRSEDDRKNYPPPKARAIASET